MTDQIIKGEIKGEITAVVNVFKRPHILAEQIEAIRSQTIPPKRIFIWNNGNSDVDLSKYKKDSDIRVFDNNYNYGVWSRFMICFMAPTEFVCVFDDDTIPGSQWFENCLNCMAKKEALYGTIGVIFPDDRENYRHLKRYGWDGPKNSTSYVDIIGHSWFFKREWLSYYVREPVNIYTKISNGEDMYLSFMLEKYANIQSCIPPHPINNLNMWGSIPDTAWKYGLDGNSESCKHYHFDVMYTDYLSRGFRTLISRTSATSEEDFSYFMNMIKNRKPFALIRPSDGEYHILQNTTLTNIDNWTFTSGSKLHTDLKDALHLASNKSCYIGIPCSDRDMAKWYVNEFDINPLYTTFANIFVNANWKKWLEFINTNKLNFNLVAPYNKSNFLISNHIEIPEYLVNDWELLGDSYIDKILSEVKSKINNIYFFSCGPIAKILISKAWAAHPHNIYIDIGSSLDLYIKGATNREYTIQDHQLSNLVCKFNSDLISL